MEGFDYPVEYTERVEGVDEPANGQRLGRRAIQSIQGVGDNSTQPKVGDESFQIDSELTGLNAGRPESGNDGQSTQSNQVSHTNQLPNSRPTKYLTREAINAIRGN